MPTRYQFCFGPWNLSEGQDPYGPPVRPAQSFDWKLAQLKKHGFDAMMFHDDDAVPDIDGKSESQIPRQCVDRLVEAFDAMLAHDKRARLAIEPKPNEPMDHAYLPTIGHALAIAQQTRDSMRVGCLIESAHAILAGH